MYKCDYKFVDKVSGYTATYHNAIMMGDTDAMTAWYAWVAAINANASLPFTIEINYY